MVVMKQQSGQGSEASVDPSGRVNKVKTRTPENEEIHVYLSKLKELVPYVPRNRKLSKLEVIHHVIDYICDLQNALDTHHPGLSTVAAVAAANSTAPSAAPAAPGAAAASRQPLGVIPPNTCTEPSLSLMNQTTSHSEKASSSDNQMVTC
ncbi:protein extra-macrochaetae [Neocloeon triangulifer]|uniref:protein extra-macrochaetae n=1 Tax=Neocloeon triangulifer TaxID=2078957 RepID=UPI00286EBE61|nr:protein extra-macrochaetae [Neocloeon triangulifer]